MKLEEMKIDPSESSCSKMKKDTGSPEAQICILEKKIGYLTRHVQNNKKDYQSNRSLVKDVSRRNRFMAYLKRTNIDRYKALINKEIIKNK